MLIHIHILLWIKVGFFLPGFLTRQFLEPLSLLSLPGGSAQGPADSRDSLSGGAQEWGDSGSEGDTAGQMPGCQSENHCSLTMQWDPDSRLPVAAGARLARHVGGGC